MAIVLGLAATADPARAQRTVRGHLFTPGDAPVVALRAWTHGAGWLDSADVSSTGDFEVALPDSGAVDLTIDARSRAPRAWHPVGMRLDPAIVATPLRLVLVPRRWTIGRGRFAGRTVDINLRDALARAGSSQGYWRVTSGSRSRSEAHAPLELGLWGVAWSAHDRPIPVAFDPARGRVSWSDSASFWASARELEEELGDTLFRPAEAAEIRDGREGILVSVDRSIHSSGLTYLSWNQRGSAYDAVMRVQSPSLLGDPRIVLHELMHAIGFGHTFAWPSVMGPGSGIDRLTATDVAYAQLLFALHEVQERWEARFARLSASERDWVPPTASGSLSRDSSIPRQAPSLVTRRSVSPRAARRACAILSPFLPLRAENAGALGCTAT